MKTKLFVLAAALFVVFSAVCNAQDMKMVFTPDNIVWADAPPVFPSGTKIAVLEGDPSKDGFFTVRFKVQGGFALAPHWHPATEHVTVISGKFYIGFGDVFDRTKGNEMGPGSIAVMPALHHHFAWADEETVIQLHGVGPWQLYYVNLPDNPPPK